MQIWIVFCHLLITFIIPCRGAACPEGCLCANNLIVCTCAGMSAEQQRHHVTSTSADQSAPTTTLSSFRGIEYISKIYIHSCRRLTILNDTFNGLDVGHEMTIMNVENLYIQPYAFRKMAKYPDRMTIKNSYVTELAENAFAGFTRIGHLWLKNVTIATVKSGAFGHVSNVKYVYIRESTLGTVEPEAFGHMTSVVHFYVRGKVNIDRLGGHLFAKSSIMNITFEEVHVNVTSPRAFSGAAHFGLMQFQNCTFLNNETSLEIGRDSESRSFHDTENGLKVEFFKTNIQEICISDFSNVQYVRFEESNIDRISSCQNGQNVVMITNIDRLYFVRSMIRDVVTMSFANAIRLQSVMFDDCVITTIESRAFHGITKIDYIVFINSKIDKLLTNSFENANVDNFIVDGCEFETFESQVFRNAKFSSLKLISNHFETVHDAALGYFQCQYAGIENNKFVNLHRRIFDEINCHVTNITENTINKLDQETFHGILSTSGRLNLNFNKFPCNCQQNFLLDFEINSFDVDRALHEMQIFNVKHNFCWSRPHGRTNFVTVSLSKFRQTCTDVTNSKHFTTVELLPTFETQGGSVACRVTLFSMTCRCRRENVDKLLIVDEMLIDELSRHPITVLIFARCQRIRFKTNSFKNANFSRLVINECRHVEFESSTIVTKSRLFRSLTLRNSNITQLPLDLFGRDTFVENVVDFVEFRNCTIDVVNSFAFRNGKFGEIRFVKSRLGELAPKFLADSKITNFTIRDSTVGRLNSYAFNDTSVQVVTVSDTKFTDVSRDVAPSEFYRTSFVCLLRNRFSCHCDVAGAVAMITANGCQNDENLCDDSDESYSKKPLYEIFVKPDSDSNNIENPGHKACYVEQTSPSQKRAVQLVSSAQGGGHGNRAPKGHVPKRSILTIGLTLSNFLLYFVRFYSTV